jgi:UDP-3-O-[3-hydroxymyristoyl] glucosamine N-acyltransferase
VGKMVAVDGARIYPSADVDERAKVGPGTTVWHLAQIRENARLGGDCIVGRDAYVRARRDHRRPGETAELRPGVPAGRLEDEVFIGPAVVLTNDVYPGTPRPARRCPSWRARAARADN